MSSDRERPSILLVDDQPANLQVLLILLQEEGFRTLVANSGDRALHHLSRHRPDIILLDVMMPGLDGFATCRRLKNDERYADIPVIFMTALSGVKDKMEGFAAGGVDYITKPFERQEVVARIRAHLTLARQQREIEEKNLKLAEFVTEQNRIQKQLAREKELLAVILRSIGDAVIATDVGGRVILMNNVAEELTGWMESDARGKSLQDIFHIIDEKTRTTCENLVEKVLSTGRIIGLSNHTVLITRDGTERSIADSAAPVRSRSGRVVGTVFVFRDVTLENRINAELAKAQRLESIGILAGGIAHDFNNLLTGILGNINLAKLQVTEKSETHSLLCMTEKATLRAGDLTKQLLTFARGGSPIKETASIYDVIKESSEFILSGSAVSCHVNCQKDLWPVEIDRGQVSQVLQNLLLNSRQAMPAGGLLQIHCVNFQHVPEEAPQLQLAEGDYVEIMIKDEGTGIPPQIRDKIFEPYFSTKQRGSGLGLTIAYSVIRKHGGHIECLESSEKGTSLVLYLPASGAALLENEPEDLAFQGKGKVLVMDDEEVVRKVAVRMLEHLGYEVDDVCDGRQAVERYETALQEGEKYDLVILDLTIPGGMGGEEAMRKLLELDPTVQAIVSTGYSNDPVMAEYRQYGFCGILEKPYILDNLKSALSRVFAR